MIEVNETFYERESEYSMRYSELEDVITFVRNHEWDDIPEYIKKHIEKWEDFLAENY